MVGIALVSPSAAVCLGQARLCDGIDFQNILSLLDIVSESIAEGYICAALSCLGIFFLGSLGTGELTFPDFYTKKESPLTPSEHVFQQDGSAWLREAFEVYFPSLMDKKEVPSLVQGLPFRLAGILASHNPAHLSSELYRRLLKKMVSAPSLSIAFAEGSLLTNYENQDKRVTKPIPGSYPIDSSKFASKLMGLEKEITKPLVNASALVIVNEEGRIRSKKPDQWGLVAATRDYDDEDGDDSDEEVEGEDDNQGDDDDDKENDDDDDDDDDEEPGGNGEASDGGDEGEDDEESEEDDDDDEDDDEDEEDDENEEDEEEPPKKKKK